MITETKEVYKCEHCRKLYQRKAACEVHEARCNQNPDNSRVCFACNHLSKENKLFYWDNYEGEHRTQVSVFHCKKLGLIMHPPITEHKGNDYEFGDVENVPMKRECDFFEDDFLTN